MKTIHVTDDLFLELHSSPAGKPQLALRRERAGIDQLHPASVVVYTHEIRHLIDVLTEAAMTLSDVEVRGG